jgi:alpha-amylase
MWRVFLGCKIMVLVYHHAKSNVSVFEGFFMKKLSSLLVLVLLGVSAVSAQETATRHWWSDTTWYLLFVRSFYDSDGDGVGDIRGIIEKLDYLNDGDPNTTTDLGIGGIWLMPVFEAASYHGYDALDYQAIEQDYGTSADFLDLMDAAHERGIKIIVDMVMNHTSSQHPWFLASSQQDATYNDWYVWADSNPNYLGPWNAKAWYEKSGRFYYAPFWSEMPDLNFKNPSVKVAMEDVAAFWLEEMGVDGFRLDAIKYVVEDEVNGNRVLANAPINRAWLAEYNAFVKSLNPEAMTIGEVWDDTRIIKKYIDEGSVDMAFDFDFATEMITGIRAGFQKNPADQLKKLVRDFPAGSFATFTSNHDQPRLLTQLEGNIEGNKAIASILLTSPGAPFIYYGEELGMVGDKPDELIRTPMQWDSTPVTGGFTTGTPWQALTPNFEEVTVASESADSTSLFNHYRTLIHLRNDISALHSGETLVAKVKGTRIYSILRYDADGAYLVVINMYDQPVDNYAISIEEASLTNLSADVIFGEGDVATPTLNATGGFNDYLPKAVIAPYETLIIRLQ